MLSGAGHDYTGGYCPRTFHSGTLRVALDPTQLKNPRALLSYLSGRVERLRGKVWHPYNTARAAASHGHGQNSAECYRKTKLEVETSLIKEQRLMTKPDATDQTKA